MSLLLWVVSFQVDSLAAIPYYQSHSAETLILAATVLVAREELKGSIRLRRIRIRTYG
jgi:hypothetical protein